MHRAKALLVILLAGLFLSAGAVRTGSSRDARKWLDRMNAAYEKGPFRVGYTAEMNTERLGQPMHVVLEGESTHKDQSHLRAQMTVKMGQGDVKRDISTLQIADGKTLWIEVNDAAGDRQVMKVSVDRAGHIAAVAALGGGSADPPGQVRDLTTKFDFQLGGVANGQVTLNATLTEEARAELSDVPPLAAAMEEVTIVLDEKTATPREMRVGGEAPFLTVRLGAFVYLDEVDASMFTCTPTEGLEVIDLDALIDSGLTDGGAATGGD
jgi:outer membrane lipoprotein-sorting protein